MYEWIFEIRDSNADNNNEGKVTTEITAHLRRVRDACAVLVEAQCAHHRHARQQGVCGGLMWWISSSRTIRFGFTRSAWLWLRIERISFSQITIIQIPAVNPGGHCVVRCAHAEAHRPAGFESPCHREPDSNLQTRQEIKCKLFFRCSDHLVYA